MEKIQPPTRCPIPAGFPCLFFLLHLCPSTGLSGLHRRRKMIALPGIILGSDAFSGFVSHTSFPGRPLSRSNHATCTRRRLVLSRPLFYPSPGSFSKDFKDFDTFSRFRVVLERWVIRQERMEHSLHLTNSDYMDHPVYYIVTNWISHHPNKRLPIISHNLFV